MISVEHIDELITRFKSGELDIRDIIEQSYFGGRADREKELSELPNEYSEKLWKNAYDKGCQQGARKFAEWLQYGKHDFCVVDYDNRLETVPFEIILAEWQEGAEQ